MKQAKDVLLHVEQLTVRFSRWGQTLDALKDLSLDVSDHEWVLVLGHNGAGKSTLLKAVAGLIEPTSGIITIRGRRTSGMSASQLAESVFIVHQDPLLGSAPLLTVFENLFAADPQAAKGIPREHLLKRYADLLEPLGLADRLRQPVKLLSGGERQLLAIAVAGVRPAPLILLDEPIAALDPTKSLLCVNEIAKLHAAGKTIVQVAHDTRLLMNHATRSVTIQGSTVSEDRLQ